MTMPYSPSRAVYEGNNAATRFPFFFRVWDASQLVVTLTSPKGVTSEAAGWTADLDTAGGEIAYLHENAPLPDGWKLAITRNMPFTQEVNLVSASRFDPQVIEDALDQATAERQQTLEMMRRAVILPATSSETPQDVVQDVYTARDDAEAAAAAAATSENAAAASATNAATSANTAADVVHSAAAEAVATASNYADAAANSAADAAQSAQDAAGAVPDNLVARVTAVEVTASDAQTTADAAKTVTDKVSSSPAPHVVAQADENGKLHVGFIPGAFVGDIRLLPFRAADLAAHCPGWYFCNGDQYALTSPVGTALNALPANFKADWGIVVSGANISIPNMFYSDGRGYFLRSVNGTTRQVGSVELDAFQVHTHVVGEVGYEQYTAQSVPQIRPNSAGNAISSNPTGRTATETRSLNVGMTLAIFLDV